MHCIISILIIKNIAIYHLLGYFSGIKIVKIAFPKRLPNSLSYQQFVRVNLPLMILGLGNYLKKKNSCPKFFLICIVVINSEVANVFMNLLTFFTYFFSCEVPADFCLFFFF